MKKHAMNLQETLFGSISCMVTLRQPKNVTQVCLQCTSAEESDVVPWLCYNLPAFGHTYWSCAQTDYPLNSQVATASTI